jgi:flagellar biosynthesis component FlhA
MKKSIQLIFAITLLIFSVSCNNKTEKKHKQSKTQSTEEHHQESDEILRLNNGNLWEANTETTEGINNMIILMNSFSEKENKKAYLTLRKGLEKEFGTIIAKCTMTGEAHNQLHKFLIPMKELFEGLNSSNIENLKANVYKINNHLAKYSKYFQ